MHGEYRTRTWIRGHAPRFLAERIPKGADCGAHEWYRKTLDLDGCYHCQVVRRHELTQPSEVELQMLERAAREGSLAALQAIDARIRESTAHVVPGLPGESLAH